MSKEKIEEAEKLVLTFGTLDEIFLSAYKTGYRIGYLQCEKERLLRELKKP